MNSADVGTWASKSVENRGETEVDTVFLSDQNGGFDVMSLLPADETIWFSLSFEED